ncbi:carbon-nitrogen hydrolase family protein [Paraburkholderia sp. IMGN_8]|uniref:carbon-nitrogen hydrolase family protein n=1 Tax=Paraburkholderia sp. IMGN_8 TaxID=3136564 RepID=UPI00310188BE
MKVAVVQAAPVPFERAATIEKTCNAIDDAAKQGAQLAVFPEAFVSGYPYWSMFVQAYDMRGLRESSRPVIELGRKLIAQAVDVRAGDLAPIQERCLDNACSVVLGMNEVVGGTLYNSQAFIDASGAIVGVRRKLLPTLQEKMLYGQGDGSDLAVFELGGRRVGGLICFENTNPLFRYSLQAQGQEIHVGAWPRGAHWSIEAMDAAARQYAIEGQCFVVSPTAVLNQGMLDALGEFGGADLRLGGGASSVVAPNGKYICKATAESEQILIVDLDFQMIIDMKRLVDGAGHFSRPDVLKLMLDKTPRTSLRQFTSTDLATD